LGRKKIFPQIRNVVGTLGAVQSARAGNRSPLGFQQPCGQHKKGSLTRSVVAYNAGPALAKFNADIFQYGMNGRRIEKTDIMKEQHETSSMWASMLFFFHFGPFSPFVDVSFVHKAAFVTAD
jgi:hypothetical protein